MKSLITFWQGYSFVAPSIIFGENEFTKRLVANKPNEHRPAPGAVDYAALFEVNYVFLCHCCDVGQIGMKVGILDFTLCSPNFAYSLGCLCNISGFSFLSKLCYK